MSDLTLAQFRAAFPAFRASVYPDAVANYRLALANKFFTAPTWADETVRNHAKCLYVAHYLLLGGKDACGQYVGDGAGMTGIVASKSVDGASVSYDNASVSEAGAGFWNSTVFGRELWQLMQVYGAGARQL